MRDESERRIEIESVRERYGGHEAIWDARDRWHSHTGGRIREYVKAAFVHLGPGSVLNAGFGGTRYLPATIPQIDADLMPPRLHRNGRAVCADVHSLPFKSASFAGCVCVGSVLNYTEPTVVVPEFARVVARGGIVVLELDITNSLEFIGTPIYKSAAHLFTTFYNGTRERVWLYSIDLILETAKRSGFEVIDARYFHLISALLLKLGFNANLASRFTTLDPIARLIPAFGRTGSNVLITLRRSA